MNLKEYQEKARSTAIYHVGEDYSVCISMIYPGLGLVGECGEVAEKIKKLYRDDNGVLTEKRKEALKKELGDCCWYLSNLCSDTDSDLQTCYEMKRSSQTHRVREMKWPQLVLHMNRCASIVAEALESWYYQYDCRLGERSRFVAITHNVTEILVCIEELANRCDGTLEDIYTTNIEKLLSRKARGKLKGDGDNR
jgi:NTP pyrophosphatase (non-canonical NTP hydrolase)